MPQSPARTASADTRPADVPASPGRRRRYGRRSAGRVVAVVGLLLVGALLSMLSAVSAQAHDALLRTDPADGSTLAVMPAQVELTFSGQILALGAKVRVAGPDGDVADGAPEVDGNTVIQAIAAGAPAGRYTVTWKVASGDGHTTSDDFGFTVRAAKVTTSAGGPTSSSAESSGAETAATVDAGTTSGSGTAGADTAGTDPAGADPAAQGTQPSTQDPVDGSPVLLIVVLAVTFAVIGGAVYLFVLAPARTDRR